MTNEQLQKEAEELYPFVSAEDDEIQEEDVSQIHKRLGYLKGRKASEALLKEKDAKIEMLKESKRILHDSYLDMTKQNENANQQLTELKEENERLGNFFQTIDVITDYAISDKEKIKMIEVEIDKFGDINKTIAQ